MANAAALQALHMSKTFGGHRALNDVALIVKPGEVHGLLGQNGSGKSTLIKILSGYHEPDAGAELHVDGRAVPLPLPAGQSQSLGISVVHQHLALIPSLNVVENMLLGRLSRSNALTLSWRKARSDVADIFARYGLSIDPSASLSRLSAVEHAMIAIVRAVEDLKLRDDSAGHGVLILDEPTPFLPKQDVDRLFGLVRQIVGAGASVLFVSHDIDEVREITDRATVLRDGRLAGTIETKGSSRDELIELIIGRALRFTRHAVRPATAEPPVVKVEDLCGGDVKSLNLNIGRGEVVGLTGLLGSGFETVNYMLYGATACERGSMTLRDRKIDLGKLTPAAALREKIVLIPGDRNRNAAIGTLPIEDNVTMPELGRSIPAWFVRRAAMRKLAAGLGEQFGVVPNRPHQPLSSLSGGNAQKVVLAKWLQTQPYVILLDEPTQGVDVGARELVFDAIRSASKGGACVICASSDYEQLSMLCDRVLVFAGGRIVAELEGDAISKETIAEACLNGDALQPVDVQ